MALFLIDTQDENIKEKDITEETETLKKLSIDPYGQISTASYNSFLIFDEIQRGLNIELKGWFLNKGKHFDVSYENLLIDNLLDDQASSGGDTERVDNDEFNYVLHQLYQLVETPDGEVDDSGGALVPTNYAVESARQLLMQSYGMLRGSFTRASVSTSYEGGIRIEWISPDSSVRAIIPDEESSKGYIYYESGELFGTQELAAGNLIRLLLEIF